MGEGGVEEVGCCVVGAGEGCADAAPAISAPPIAMAAKEISRPKIRATAHSRAEKPAPPTGHFAPFPGAA